MESKLDTKTLTDAKSQRELELEDIHGAAALKWVAEQNQAIKDRFCSSSAFKEMEKTLLSFYEDKRKIPYITMDNGYYYNFWQDENHVQGIWRRTTLEEYRKPEPQWELLLDIDALPEEEEWLALSNNKSKDGENWVYGGVSISPDGKRGLVALSLGGGDATMVREFDINQKKFIKDGFVLPENKSLIYWRDCNSVWVGTKFDDNSLTDSGYPKFAKLWLRGEPLEQAKTVFEGQTSDVSVCAFTYQSLECNYYCVSRSITFYESEYFMINVDLSLTRLPIPLHAELEDFFHGQAIISLRKDWETDAGQRYTAGSVIALDLSSIHDPKQLKLSLIFEPTDTCFMSSVCTTKNNIFLTLSQNVSNEIVRFTYEGKQWVSSLLELDNMGDATVISAENISDNLLLSYENFLIPSTFYYYDGEGKTISELKKAPSRFDPQHIEVHQFFAQSKDGTKVPYFIAHPKKMVYDGTNPTLLYGYGGFEVALTPSYLGGTTGTLWVAEGGVYVQANTRGGSEFGPKWHQAALKENRHKAFEDFIAVAEDLIERKITSPKNLGISGASNGGLLMGAVLTMHPELFNAVVCEVPLLDMLNYHTMLAGASWMAEYGDPDDPTMREILKGYSPFHNVFEDKKYPEVLFKTSTEDDRVHPGHARKMVDKMQSMRHKVYYYENTEGGHGGASNLKQQAFSEALSYTYLKEKLIQVQLNPALVTGRSSPGASEAAFFSPSKKLKMTENEYELDKKAADQSMDLKAKSELTPK